MFTTLQQWRLKFELSSSRSCIYFRYHHFILFCFSTSNPHIVSIYVILLLCRSHIVFLQMSVWSTGTNFQWDKFFFSNTSFWLNLKISSRDYGRSWIMLDMMYLSNFKIQVSFLDSHYSRSRYQKSRWSNMIPRYFVRSTLCMHIQGS